MNYEYNPQLGAYVLGQEAVKSKAEEAERDFLDGFAVETGLSASEANEAWAAFSRMLSDAQIRRIEHGGYNAGVREGKKFRKLYPATEEEV